MKRKEDDCCPFCRRMTKRPKENPETVPMALHQVVVAQRDMLERELDALRKEVARLQPINID